MAHKPQILWAQRNDRLTLSIQLEDICDEKISVTENTFEFSAKSRDKEYAVSFEFYEEIIPIESKQRKGGREFFFDLKKKQSGPFWPRPINTAQSPEWLKVDFNRWKDEDEGSTEDELGFGGEDDEDEDDGSLEDLMRDLER